MAAPLHVSRSRTYPVPVADAYAHTLALPLEQLFSTRFGPIPPIAGTTQEGEWGARHQVRTVRLADGGTMQERLVAVDPPHRFAYELTDVTGPMKPLATHIEGEWAFDAVGTGTRITWSWVIHPKGTVGRVAMPVFGRLWNGYARRALDRLEGLLLAA